MKSKQEILESFNDSQQDVTEAAEGQLEVYAEELSDALKSIAKDEFASFIRELPKAKRKEIEKVFNSLALSISQFIDD